MISLIAFIVICVLYWIYKEKTNSFAVFDFKRGWLIMVILKLTKTFFCITNILTNSIFTGCSISFIRKLRYLRYMPRRRLTSFIFEKIWMMFITVVISLIEVCILLLGCLCDVLIPEPKCKIPQLYVSCTYMHDGQPEDQCGYYFEKSQVGFDHAKKVLISIT